MVVVIGCRGQDSAGTMVVFVWGRGAGGASGGGRGVGGAGG